MKKLLRLRVAVVVAVLILTAGSTSLNAVCGGPAYETTTHFFHHIYQCSPGSNGMPPICADWFEEDGTLYESCDGTVYCDGDCDPSHAAYETFDRGRRCDTTCDPQWP